MTEFVKASLNLNRVIDSHALYTCFSHFIFQNEFVIQSAMIIVHIRTYVPLLYHRLGLTDSYHCVTLKLNLNSKLQREEIVR